MIEFNIGDRVKYNVTGGNNPLYRLAGMSGTVQHPISPFQVGVRVLWDDGTMQYHNADYLCNTGKVVGDDPLPPAPESGLYFSHNNWRVATLKLGPGVVAIGITGADLRVCLTPETALVMAHDLRRMAMELKRKQKQENE